MVYFNKIPSLVTDPITDVTIPSARCEVQDETEKRAIIKQQ
jgi:hypothetical protein